MTDVLDHFVPCSTCGQLVDARDPTAIAHHHASGHAPLSEPDATRLVSLKDRLRVALWQGALRQRATHAAAEASARDAREPALLEPRSPTVRRLLALSPFNRDRKAKRR